MSIYFISALTSLRWI